jgi:tRNA(Ile)-lysidine synthase
MARTRDLYSRWALEMRRSGFFKAGDRIGVAVSGGPDSILLLAFMKQLAREMGLTPVAVHFNHRLRGAEADADERFVCEQARRLGIDWMRGEGDVSKVARERHRNIEATARNLRYQFFFSLVNQGRVDKIVTAHTANDQAETVLLKLLRGAGTRGLGGIFPVLETKVVRPFLSVTRAEVEQEMKKLKLESRQDSSNENLNLRRNKIRKELLPLLQREFNPEVINLLKDLAERARDDEDCLESLAHERARPWRVQEGSEQKIPARSLSEFPVAIGRRVLRQMIQAVRGNLRGVTYRQIEALRRFAVEAQSGRRLMLPGAVEARREFDWLVLAPSLAPQRSLEYCHPVVIPGGVSVPQIGLTFQFKIIGPEDGPRAYNASGAVGLDPLKLSGPLVLRNWRAGDKFWASGSREARNLKGFFARRKIPQAERRVWPVLAAGDEIVWARDFPPANHKIASPNAKWLLVTVDKTETNG